MRFAFAWLVAAVVVALVSIGGAAAAPPGGYVVHPLVSNNGVPGTMPDAHLVNAWGLAAGPERRGGSTTTARDWPRCTTPPA